MPVPEQRDNARLLDGFTPLRRVTTSDSPWPGTLVRTEDALTRLAVDAATVNSSWSGWSADPDGHLLGAVEVVRTPTGHDVLLAHCVERLEDFLARRDRASMPLTDGEVVTLVVSALRARSELGTEAESGEWWLTEDGRPVLAVGAGAESALHATEGVLSLVAGTTGRLADLARSAAKAASAERASPRDLDEIEAQLFAAARPLALNVAIARASLPRRARRARSANRIPDPAEDRSPLRAALTHVDGDLADLVSKATTSIWRRARAGSRARAGARRRPLIFAGCVAVLILGAGLLWPGDSPGPSTVTPRATGSIPTATSGPTPARTTASPVASVEDAVAALLDARRACQGDAACLEHVQESPETSFPAGPIDADAADRTITLLDEFGGAAVLRIDGDAAAQLVVIVQRADEWLLRDVQDVAEQP